MKKICQGLLLLLAAPACQLIPGGEVLPFQTPFPAAVKDPDTPVRPSAAPVEEDTTQPGLAEVTGPPDHIGSVLAQLDNSIGTWQRLMLAGTVESRDTARLMGIDTVRLVRRNYEDIITQLATGPVSNRRVAAAALGFSAKVEAKDALLAALGDPDDVVVSHSLLGLSQLADPTTPLDPVQSLLQAHPDGEVRANAARCVVRLTRRGARHPELEETLLGALLDPEGAVRVQVIESLARLGFVAATGPLIDALDDPLALVRQAARVALTRLTGQDHGPDPAAWPQQRS